MTMKYKITAWLFILFGLGSLVSFIIDLQNGKLSLNIGICCLFVGVGLLRNFESSKMWVRLWTWLFFLLIGIMIGAVSFGIASVMNYSVKDGTIYYIIGYGVTIPLLVVPLWMNYAIASSK